MIPMQPPGNHQSNHQGAMEIVTVNALSNIMA